ncbi:MAG: Crp/Fnr family transcriptional regulator [Betaproteobacteria bacterium]
MPRADLARVMKSLERVDLRLGQILHEPHEPHEHFYFPETCIVSLLGILANGDSSEVSLTGREGCVGLALVLGDEHTLLRATVQSAGTALRWKTSALRQELKRGGAVEKMLLHYVQAVWTQTAQSALCNRHHTLEQQMCRWFLTSLDRVNGNTLRMTQKLIGNMLGVRRERVAMAAKRMRIRGWLAYQNGTVTVLNRAALEGCSCECYGVIKAEYYRLFQGTRKKRDGSRKAR